MINVPLKWLAKVEEGQEQKYKRCFEMSGVYSSSFLFLIWSLTLFF